MKQHLRHLHHVEDSNNDENRRHDPGASANNRGQLARRIDRRISDVFTWPMAFCGKRPAPSLALLGLVTY